MMTRTKRTVRNCKNREGWIEIKKKKETEVTEEAEKMPVGAKVFDIAFTVFVYLLAAAIIFGALLFAFNTSDDKAIFGYRYYTITTGSMSPVYNVGDMIFVKLASGEEINVGDVITFNPSQDSDANLTHRVTEKIENYEGTGVICFRTRGDANKTEDSFLIDEDRVIGVVTFGIPMVGYIVRFVQLRWYIIVPIIIMIAVFFQLLKRYFMIGKDEDEIKEELATPVAVGPDPKKSEKNTDEKESEKSTSEK